MKIDFPNVKKRAHEFAWVFIVVGTSAIFLLCVNPASSSTWLLAGISLEGLLGAWLYLCNAHIMTKQHECIESANDCIEALKSEIAERDHIIRARVIKLISVKREDRSFTEGTGNGE